jgi:hypothetical protein
VTSLADAVLPLIRTRGDLWRWDAADAQGDRMHVGIDILERELPSADPQEAYAVVHKALASAVKVIARADDSSGVIGDACRRLLELHPRVAAAAAVSPSKLVEWMLKFQFDGDVDYFEINPAAYTLALGEKGMRSYRARLDARRADLPPINEETRWTGPHAHEYWVLDWNERRLAVFDRDVDEIIRTHARERKVAATFEDTARALEEVGEIELAILWAHMATEFDLGRKDGPVRGRANWSISASIRSRPSPGSRPDRRPRRRGWQGSTTQCGGRWGRAPRLRPCGSRAAGSPRPIVNSPMPCRRTGCPRP